MGAGCVAETFVECLTLRARLQQHSVHGRSCWQARSQRREGVAEFAIISAWRGGCVEQGTTARHTAVQGGLAQWPPHRFPLACRLRCCQRPDSRWRTHREVQRWCPGHGRWLGDRHLEEAGPGVKQFGQPNPPRCRLRGPRRRNSLLLPQVRLAMGPRPSLTQMPPPAFAQRRAIFVVFQTISKQILPEMERCRNSRHGSRSSKGRRRRSSTSPAQNHQE